MALEAGIYGSLSGRCRDPSAVCQKNRRFFCVLRRVRVSAVGKYSGTTDVLISGIGVGDIIVCRNCGPYAWYS